MRDRSRCGGWAGPLSFNPQPRGGIKGALLPGQLHLWRCDKSAGHYLVAPGSAANGYVPHMRKAPKTWTIAFAEGWAANPFSVPIPRALLDYLYVTNLSVWCDLKIRFQTIPVVLGRGAY